MAFSIVCGRSWSLQFDTIAAAEKASKKQPEANAAAARGISLEEYLSDPNRLTLRQAVEKFLTARARKAPRTLRQYTFITAGLRGCLSPLMVSW